MSRYGWIVDVDHLHEDFAVNAEALGLPGVELELADDQPSSVGVIGPRSIPDKIRDRLRLLRGDQVAHRWRTKDDDGELYHSGRYVGPDDMRMFAPLEDFSQPDAGATTIEYLNTETGAWESL